VPALREVSLIVLGSFSVEPANAIALIKAGATDILTRPVAVEALMRLRHAVGTSQSLTQQRAHRREEGGARLVTQYIMRKEREGRAEGLPPSVLMGGAERRDGSEPPRPSVRSNALLGEVTVTVLLMQRESRKSAELPALLSECGYQVKVARTKHEVLKQLYVALVHRCPL
jgi:DNA-binding response OmpR family regulator